MKILIVEDDDLIAKALTTVLTNHNYAVEVASDGEAGWDLIELYAYDLILLDLLLPKLDGISLCQRVRSKGYQVPILLLTGRDSSHDKAIGLDAGADDYLVKPFDPEELVARVRALLRRGTVTSAPVLEWGKLRLDPASCEVTHADQPLSLTPKEYALLELFLRNPQRVFSCGMILEHLWAFEELPGEEAVRTHIKGLRQKLKPVGEKDLIETVYGVGYRLRAIEGKTEDKLVVQSSRPKQSLPEANPQQTLAAIRGVWEKSQARIDQQMTVLEQAVAALDQQTLSPDLRQQAIQEAHTLGGSLGMFGFANGSDLARSIERLLTENSLLDSEQVNTVRELVIQLRQLIQLSPNSPTSSSPITPSASIIPEPDPTSLGLLQQSKDKLELRVAECTAELISTNEQLRRELNERRQIEEALRISQIRSAGILEIADDAIIAIDSAQRITLFNQGAEKIFGYTAKEVMHQHLDLLLPTRFAQAHRDHIVEFSQMPQLARRMGERREIFGRRNGGEEFPAEASISRLKVEGETIFTVILRDITARKQAEQTLEQLSRQNELILNSVGEGICGLNLQGEITFVNPAAAKLLGYSIEALINQPFHCILPDAETSLLGASREAGAIHQTPQATFYRQDGSSFPVEYVSTPIREPAAIVGYVITFRDITERQIIERMKNEFISIVSHELRTPLTSIHGSLGMLASGLLDSQPETGKRLLEIAVNSTDRLMRLINDILDIERIESGKVTMTKQSCDASDLMVRAADVMQGMAEKFGVSLVVLPVSSLVWADSDRIIQTLTNLLSNAIKFSPAGSTVWLSAAWLSAACSPTSDQQAAQLLFTIKDEGRGIPHDKLETIFERFQQVDASDSRNQDGTGLGLAICRNIVQQHGGKIWVESQLGEGSTFYFTLPARIEE